MRARGTRLNPVNLFLWFLGGGIVLIALVGAFLTLQAGRFSADQWETLIIAGIALGSVYALIALGYTLV